MPPKPARRVEEEEDIIDSGSDTESESEEDEDTVRILSQSPCHVSLFDCSRSFFSSYLLFYCSATHRV